MDADRFDLFVRALAASPSRRGLARALTGLTGLSLAGGLAARIGEGDVAARNKKRRKKKRNKRKKKECKKRQKKCGKKCIPETSCCTSAECGGGATCQNGACLCPTGQKDCQGTCIPKDDCCSACIGDQTCEGGECTCPPLTIPCGDECIPDTACCTPADCGDLQTCVDQDCVCTGADELACGFDCCSIGSEVCYVNHNDDEPNTCVDGGCPSTDICEDPWLYFCDETCGCTSTVDSSPVNVCVDGLAPIDCTIVCASSDDCTDGTVCIRDLLGDCGCGNNFCIPLCEFSALSSAEADRDSQHQKASIIGTKSRARGDRQGGGKGAGRDRRTRHGS